MADIVLTTLNARYAHASFGLRYLMANLGDLQARAVMLEFDIHQRPSMVAEKILAHQPRIVGLGVYIWNVIQMTEVARDLRARDPAVDIVVGGPEVSFEVDQQEICSIANYVVTGEADHTFPVLCRKILESQPPATRIVESPPADVRKLASPYSLYNEEDIAHRVIYVEASRGCPFTCEFCLSSLDVPLRRFPLETLLPEFQSLLDRGVQVFKFVDRTFNLSIKYSMQLMEFFLQRYRPGLFLHFEMIPDRLPEELRTIIKAFPRGSLQFEVGIQTFNLEVAERIRRKQDYDKSVDNLRFLLDETGSYIHADLIFGLPGESYESFAAGFDRLVALRPQEIQVNVLKRLRGTPITRHDAEWQMVYSQTAPYDVLHNKLIDVETMQRLRCFAKFWDLYSNSGNFIESTPLLWRSGTSFHRFMAFSDWLITRTGKTYGLSLDELAKCLFDYLTNDAKTELGAPAGEIAQVLWRDYSRGAQRDMPVFLRAHLDYESHRTEFRKSPLKLKRQARRLAETSSEQISVEETGPRVQSQ